MNAPLRLASAAALLAALTLPGQAQTIIWGVPHLPVDNAQLTVPQGGGKLKVSNLGSSGCDGVSMAVTETDRFQLALTPLLPTSYPPTAGFELEVFGEIGGVPDQSTARLVAVRSGQDWSLTPTFSAMGTTTYTLEVYDQGALVHTSSGHSDGSSAASIAGVDSYYMKTTSGPGGEIFEFCVSAGFTSSIAVSGGPTVQGDMITVRSEDGGATTGPALSRVDMMGTDLGLIEILDESIDVFGMPHTGLGDVRLDPTGGRLKVSNLGSSGCDGVSIAPDPAGGISIEIVELPLVNGPPAPGDYVEVQNRGTVNGVPDAAAGTTRLTATQTGVDITADYSALGATGLIVEVYDDGVLVTSIPCAVNPTVSVPLWPTGYDKRPYWIPDNLPCISWEWAFDLLFTIPGSGTFTGDQLVFMAEDPLTILEDISEVSIMGMGTSLQIEITNEVRTELPGYLPYCASGTSASGCQAILSASGTASASGTFGFVLSVTDIEGGKDGLFFYGQNGKQATPWGNGTSLQCVIPPVRRGGLQAGSGTNGSCDGGASQDLNARWCPTCPKPTHAPVAGMPLQVQFWYRDPFNTSSQTTSLSNAVEVNVDP